MNFPTVPRRLRMRCWTLSSRAGDLPASQLGWLIHVGDSNRHASSLRYFVRRTETIMGACGLSIVNLEGQPYDPGIPASAMNLGDFG